MATCVVCLFRRRSLVTLDGVSLNAYACSAELNGNSGLNLDGIGTFCHEYSHTLGLPDFYDIDYSGAMGMSWWSIMAHGNYGVNGYVPIGYNAYEREFCGWLEFNELTDNSSIRMPELTTDNAAAYKITSTNANQYVTITAIPPNVILRIFFILFILSHISPFIIYLLIIYFLAFFVKSALQQFNKLSTISRCSF